MNIYIVLCPLNISGKLPIMQLVTIFSPFFSVIQRQRIIIQNSYGEKLVGVLHETGSLELVILCHGFRSSKVGNCDI